jgi:AcrR family transcriptional regulator
VEQRTYSKRQAQAAATQELLLRAAHDVFAERGYQGTTVGAITKAANTAHGTFYLYFRNKEDAFSKVVESVMFDVYDRALSFPLEGDLRDLLAQALRGFLEVFVRNAGIWRALLEGAFTTPSIEDAWGEIRAGFVRRVSAMLRELQAAGLVRPLDADLTATAMGAMVEWTVTTQFVFRKPQVEATFDDTVATLTDLWYHAVSPAVSAELG